MATEDDYEDPADLLEDEDEDDEDDEDLDIEIDDDLGLDAIVADDDEDVDVEDDDDDDEVDLEDDDESDDEEAADDDAGEESLDVLLAREQADDDVLVRLDDEPRDGLVSVTTPIGADEFTCRSCFLVKRRAQLANEKKMICLDCA